MSSSAWRAAPAIAANVSRRRAPGRGGEPLAGAACTTMTLIAWATMSCSSDAMRARS